MPRKVHHASSGALCLLLPRSRVRLVGIPHATEHDRALRQWGAFRADTERGLDEGFGAGQKTVEGLHTRQRALGSPFWTGMEALESGRDGISVVAQVNSFQVGGVMKKTSGGIVV
jgi:hypothetical protein